MSTWGGTPAASACTAWARPISPPSGVTEELSAMFCALKGATRSPSWRNSRQSAVTSRLLPTEEAVPCTMMAGRQRHERSRLARRAERSLSRSAAGRAAIRMWRGRPKEAQLRTRMRRLSSRPRSWAPSSTGTHQHEAGAAGHRRAAPGGRARPPARAGRPSRRSRQSSTKAPSRQGGQAGGLGHGAGGPGRPARLDAPGEGGGGQQVAEAQPGDGVVLGQRAHPHDVGRDRDAGLGGGAR